MLERKIFLFVATNHVTSASAESLIKAVQGLAAEARAACSMEPLVIPLMGSGLSRVGVKNSRLVDLILTGVRLHRIGDMSTID